MILYRALNKDDMRRYYTNDHIFCTLFNATTLDNNGKKISKNLTKYYNLCLCDKRKYALDSIVGHISGKRLGVNISPWVSTSTNFDFVACEYAVPQSGNYNFQHERKPILVIEYDDDKIYSDSDSIYSLRDTKDYDFAIDLRNGKLNEYYDNGAVSSEKYNKDMPGYDVIADINKELNVTKTSVTGFSNYATAANEIILFGAIDKTYNKFLIYPIIQDIMYSCNIDINYIIKNIDKINEILKDLYPMYKVLYPNGKNGVNLTDLLVEKYEKLKGETIEEKYVMLKNYKADILSKIVKELNDVLHSNFTVNRLVDDKIIVSSYDNLNMLSEKQRYDLIIIEKDGKLYSYSCDNSKYSSEEETITRKDVYTLIRKKTIQK